MYSKRLIFYVKSLSVTLYYSEPLNPCPINIGQISTIISIIFFYVNKYVIHKMVRFFSQKTTFIHFRWLTKVETLLDRKNLQYIK